MPEIVNIHNFPHEYIDSPGPDSPMRTYYMGDACGSEKMYVNIDFIEPGARSAKYHSHSSQEEFFLILKGSGTLRYDGEMFRVKEGDCIAKPAGKNHAHQFINDGEDILQILDCGVNKKGDVITYPDEGKIFVKRVGKVFDLNGAVTNWSSDPNPED